MKKNFFIVLLVSLVLSTGLDGYAQTPSSTFYVVTRSTKAFRIGSQQNPTVGLFSTQDRGKTWKHYGWDYTKCFSVSTAVVGKNRLFYLACGNGVQKSVDAGKHWQIATGWEITECLKTAIDPRDPQTVYAATAYGIFKSTDAGKTWQEKNAGLASTFTPALVIDKSDPNRLFCATESGIHFSRNGGELWQPVALLGLGIRTLIQHPKNPALLAAGTENDGVFVSIDHGRTWQQKSAGLTHKTVYALAFAPQDEQTLYAGTFQGGVFKTTTAGETWSAVNTGLNNLDIHALLVDPQNQNAVFAGTLNDGVWLSDDGGAHWRFIGLETSQVWDMLMVE